MVGLVLPCAGLVLRSRLALRTLPTVALLRSMLCRLSGVLRPLLFHLRLLCHFRLRLDDERDDNASSLAGMAAGGGGGDARRGSGAPRCAPARAAPLACVRWATLTRASTYGRCGDNGCGMPRGAISSMRFRHCSNFSSFNIVRPFSREAFWRAQHFITFPGQGIRGLCARRRQAGMALRRVKRRGLTTQRLTTGRGWGTARLPHTFCLTPVSASAPACYPVVVLRWVVWTSACHLPRACLRLDVLCAFRAAPLRSRALPHLRRLLLKNAFATAPPATITTLLRCSGDFCERLRCAFCCELGLDIGDVRRIFYVVCKQHYAFYNMALFLPASTVTSSCKNLNVVMTWVERCFFSRTASCIPGASWLRRQQRRRRYWRFAPPAASWRRFCAALSRAGGARRDDAARLRWRRSACAGCSSLCLLGRAVRARGSAARLARLVNGGGQAVETIKLGSGLVARGGRKSEPAA